MCVFMHHFIYEKMHNFIYSCISVLYFYSFYIVHYFIRVFYVELSHCDTIALWTYLVTLFISKPSPVSVSTLPVFNLILLAVSEPLEMRTVGI